MTHNGGAQGRFRMAAAAAACLGRRSSANRSELDPEGFAMTKALVKQVAHVCIFARDLAATEAFWTGVLGMQVAFRFTRNGAPFGFYLDAGGRTNVEVFEKTDSEFSERNQINHICLEVNSLDDAVAAIRAKGVEITEKKLGVDDTWQAWTADPNGVKIELFEYTEKSAQFAGGDRAANW
jgi:glyoxylase I family protein